jgi:branched-chain amino acid transport system substrate-binding protein
MGQKFTFLGGDAWALNLYKYGGDAIDGCYYSGHWYPDPENQTAGEFYDRYTNSFNREEIVSLGFAHDAVFLLADAVGRAGALEPSKIRDALAATKDFQGVTGTITMDQNGDPVKPITFFKFEEGQSVPLKKVRP